MKDGYPENSQEVEQLFKKVATSDESYKALLGIFRCKMAEGKDMKKSFKETLDYYGTLLLNKSKEFKK